MTERSRKGVMLSILAVAVAWGIYNQPWTPPAPEDSASETSALTPAPDGPQPAIAAVGLWRGQDMSELDWSPDPFRYAAAESTDEPPVAQPDPAFVPVLQGTMSVKGTMRCVLDGRLCDPGDAIGRWRVERIEPGMVTLRDADGGRVTLHADKTKGTQGERP